MANIRAIKKGLARGVTDMRKIFENGDHCSVCSHINTLPDDSVAYLVSIADMQSPPVVRPEVSWVFLCEQCYFTEPMLFEK
jgi:hypothetical protein